jgi:hypothetical protein
MKNLTWREIYPEIIFGINTLKKAHANPYVIEEITELLRCFSIFSANPPLNHEDIVSINLDLKLARSPKGKNFREEYSICGVITNPRDLLNFVDEAEEFVAYSNYYYSLNGTVSMVVKDRLYIGAINVPV